MTGSTTHPSTLIVVVNYCTPELTCDCLESLCREHDQYPRFQVVVTDNASSDDSVPQLNSFVARHGLENWVSIMPLSENGGFAFGNNAAIHPALDSQSPPDYVLLLNPDTVVQEGAIEALVRFMDERPDVGIVGSRLEEPDGTPQVSAFRFPTIPGEFDKVLRFGPVRHLLKHYVIAPPIPDEPVQTDWVSGASILIRREVFDEIGLLDERYFMYYEEVDFCWRARQAGWTCWYVPSSRVIHLVGQASGVTNTKIKRKRRPAYWFESRRRFFVRNKGPIYSLGCDLAMLLGLSLWDLRCWLQGKHNYDPPHLLIDSLRNSVFLRGFSV